MKRSEEAKRKKKRENETAKKEKGDVISGP